MTTSKKKTRDKVSRVELIPKVGNDLRGVLISALHSLEVYQLVVSKGANLFTKDQLESIEETFGSKKVTWEVISQLLIDHKIDFSKPTFRRHIEKGLIPQAIDYGKVEGKRVAFFKIDVIAHINFNRFFLKFAPVDYIKKYRDALYSIATISLYEIVGYKTDEFSVDLAIFSEFVAGNDCLVENTIGRYLPRDHANKDAIQTKINQINELTNQLNNELGEFYKILNETKLSIKQYLSVEKETSHAN